MSRQRGAWISQRGQFGAAAAIDQVLDQQPHVDEAVQQLPDAWIEDSPYQARQPFSTDSVEDLAQGMREAGFQGVLIVRPHGDLSKRQGGRMQLVYGHRRRAAWRCICAERGALCVLPVVVRDISDERMLTIGAQENLQRQDLDPLEEAQIVAWHEHMFFDKNQTEIGALLGKSSDWVSVRSRIHKLPDALKDRLRQRPRAIAQLLELGAFYGQHPTAALALADRVIQEQLTLDKIRALVRGYVRPEQREPTHLGLADRRGTATNVPEITNTSILHAYDVYVEGPDAVTSVPEDDSHSALGNAGLHETTNHLSVGAQNERNALNAAQHALLLCEAADTLTFLADCADLLALDARTETVLDQIGTALHALRLRHSELRKHIQPG